ncbi:hypothetical protein GCM10009592_28530 [Brachybacterium rhamnosum]|uniref:Helix-turn-helix domain-containing protein n=1 Tax=Brachybacterium rhamnosum TaxID=173361 RepID=A0ABW4Q1W4_9MICO
MTTSPLDDFEQQNHINRYRNRLDDIRTMLNEIPDTMLTISSYAMDLAGSRATTEPALPGGEALILTGPWSSDATHGDDTPHPAQTITEWAHTIHDAHGQVPPHHLRFPQAIRYLHDQTPWILTSPWAPAWQRDIDAVHGRLRSLCPPEVDHHHDDAIEHDQITEDQLWDALALHPDHELTRRDLAHLGIPASTVTTWRHRGKVTETSPGRYRAGDIVDARRTA